MRNVFTCAQVAPGLGDFPLVRYKSCPRQFQVAVETCRKRFRNTLRVTRWLRITRKMRPRLHKQQNPFNFWVFSACECKQSSRRVGLRLARINAGLPLLETVGTTKLRYLSCFNSSVLAYLPHQSVGQFKSASWLFSFAENNAPPKKKRIARGVARCRETSPHNLRP